MRALDLFLPLVAPVVMGAPEPLLLQALRMACIEFCRRTDTVQCIQAPVAVVAGTQDYAVTVPADMVLVRVLGAAWQGVWLVPVPPDDVTSDVALRGAAIGAAIPLSGAPRHFFQKTPDLSTISLYPIPDVALAGGLLIKASFCPTQAATQVEDALFDEWAEGIAAGAAARVLAIPGQGFTGSPAGPAARFERAVSEAKRQKMFGKMTAGARVQPRRFA